MQGNGIGPLVSQFVHERNALRAASRVQQEEATESAPAAIKPHPHADTVEFSASALARFEALKAKLGGRTSEEEPTTAPEAAPEVVEPQPVPEPIETPDASLGVEVRAFFLSIRA